MRRTLPLTARRAFLMGAMGTALLTVLRTSASERKLAPFSLLDVEGQRVDVGEWIGRDVLMVVFWATWCACCLEELPRLEALRQDYADRGFRLVAVNIDPPKGQTRAASQMKRIRFGGAALMDPEGKVVDVYNKQKKTPTSLIVDRDGVIRRTVVGAPPGTEDELRALLEPLLTAGD